MKRALLGLAAAFATSSCGDNPAEEAVRRTLIDPDAGEFRDVERCSGDSDVWTGEVNGKNRMGAFTGFEPFFYDGVTVAYAADARFSDLMNRCYSHLNDAANDAEAVADAAINGLPKTGGWFVSEDANPLDDSKRIVASLTASEGVSSYGDVVTFVARCASNTTEVYVNWNDYLGDDSRSVYNEWKYVTVRVGDEDAQRQQWSISTDSKATFAPGSSIELLRRMAKVDRLVLQTTPYNENPITAVFNLEGIDTALKPIAEECNWQL